MIYHVSHERNVFPQLGIPPDEKVVAHALPKIEIALQVLERQLAHGQGFLLSAEVGLADYYLLPSTYAFGLAPEAKAMYADLPAVRGWRERMEALPTVQRFRAAQPPRAPIAQAQGPSRRLLHGRDDLRLVIVRVQKGDDDAQRADGQEQEERGRAQPPSPSAHVGKPSRVFVTRTMRRI
jgi:hypothetical protein